MTLPLFIEGPVPSQVSVRAVIYLFYYIFIWIQDKFFFKDENTIFNWNWNMVLESYINMTYIYFGSVPDVTMLFQSELYVIFILSLYLTRKWCTKGFTHIYNIFEPKYTTVYTNYFYSLIKYLLEVEWKCIHKKMLITPFLLVWLSNQMLDNHPENNVAI